MIGKVNGSLDASSIEPSVDDIRDELNMYAGALLTRHRGNDSSADGEEMTSGR